MKTLSDVVKIWDLAEKIFVQLHAVPNTKNLKTNELVKMSYKIAEEFYDQKTQTIKESRDEFHQRHDGG